MENVKEIRAYEIVEKFFLIVLGVYLIFLAEESTKFNFEYSINIENYLYNSLCFITIIKEFIFLWAKRRRLRDDKTLCKNALIIIGSAIVLWVVFYNVYQSDEYRFLLFLGVLVVGTVGSDYKKIMRTHVIAVGLFIGSAILASLSGYIENILQLRKGLIHSSWGIICTSDFGSIIIYLCITAWIAWKTISFKVFFAIGTLSVLNSIFIARSTTSTIIGVLFLLAVIYDAIPKKRGKKTVAFVLQLVFPFFAFLTFFIEYLYHKGTSIGIKINQFMHGRFIYIDNGFNTHKLSLFGTPFEQIGNGGNTFAKTGYNFIDSTYVLILLRYGIILFVAIMVLWALMTRKAVKMGDWRLALGLGLIAFHSFSEHHFPEANYNILIILPFSVLGMGWLVKDKSAEGETKTRDISRFWIGLILAGLTFVFILIAGPHLLSLARTFFDVTSDIVTKNKDMFVSIAFMGVLALSIVLITTLYRLIILLYDKHRDKTISIRKKIVLPLIVSATVIVVFASAYIEGKHIVNRRSLPYMRTVEAEKTAIEVIKSAIRTSGGVFYADELPYIYSQEYGGVTNDFFQGDELAEKTDVTVLMDADYESAPLLAMGFLYTEISDEHALYSNDAEVIRGLKGAGYHLTGYFSRKLTVDMKEEAERNNLLMTSDGCVKIEGLDKSLRYGPYFDLRSGIYTVTYDLSLPNVDNYDVDYKVCTLRISVRWGNQTIVDVPVFRSDFDEEGRFRAEVKSSISEARGCEFKVYPEGSRTVLLNGISCQKTPDTDVHRSVDKKGRVIRDSYFDLEGNPTETSSGYHMAEYEYNNENLISSYHYYDAEGNPVIVSTGYASVSKKYDIRKRVIRETYYDLDGSRLTYGNGCSSIAFGYDENNNMNEYRYYDADDTPVMISAGYSILRQTFDDNKRVISESYYDVDDNPVMISAGYARVVYDYDDVGRETCRRFYGVDGRLTDNSTGFAQKWRMLDKEGKVLREDYYGSDGNRIVVSGGYSIVEYRYDIYGNQTDTYFYDENERPVMYGGAYFHVRREYNKEHQIAKETFFDTNDEAIVRTEGYVTVEREYDDVGNAVVLRFLDVNNSLVLRTDGFAEVHYSYNEKRQIIKAVYYDTLGKPAVLSPGHTIVEYVYDENGNQTIISYYDVKGNPVRVWDVFSKIYREYNELKQVVREEYHDESGNIMMRADGFAATEREYDDAGNLTEMRYLDTAGKLSLNTSGYAILRREYDAAKHITKEYYLGLNSEAVDCTSGYATVENIYDEAGNLVKTVYYNAKGEAVG